MAMVRLKNPPEEGSEVVILGEGAEAAPRVLAILEELELL